MILFKQEYKPGLWYSDMSHLSSQGFRCAKKAINATERSEVVEKVTAVINGSGSQLFRRMLAKKRGWVGWMERKAAVSGYKNLDSIRTCFTPPCQEDSQTDQ